MVYIYIAGKNWTAIEGRYRVEPWRGPMHLHAHSRCGVINGFDPYTWGGYGGKCHVCKRVRPLRWLPNPVTGVIEYYQNDRVQVTVPDQIKEWMDQWVLFYRAERDRQRQQTATPQTAPVAA